MRKLISIALLAALALPAGVSAQSSRELRNDRREIQEQRQDVRQARRTGDRSDVRSERRDVRGARQEYREDLRDNRNRNYGRNDWRAYRTNHRSLYARGNWRAPFRYNSFRAGYRIQPRYYGSRYWISDPQRYRLPRARANSRWIRHYNDVLLVDYRRNIVLDVIRGFYF